MGTGAAAALTRGGQARGAPAPAAVVARGSVRPAGATGPRGRVGDDGHAGVRPLASRLDRRAVLAFASVGARETASCTRHRRPGERVPGCGGRSTREDPWP